MAEGMVARVDRRLVRRRTSSKSAVTCPKCESIRQIHGLRAHEHQKQVRRAQQCNTLVTINGDMPKRCETIVQNQG